MSDDSKSAGKKKIPLQNRLSSIVGHGQEKLTSRVKEWDARKALDAVLGVPLYFDDRAVIASNIAVIAQ